MPRVAKELSALEVKRLAHPGGAGNRVAPVGGVPGLMLQLTPLGGKTWLLRTKVGERRREIGLGGFPAVSLAEARDKAREMRAKIEAGIDPVEERKAARAALIAMQRRALTFAEAVERALAARLDSFKNAKHRQQWVNTLQAHAVPELGKMLVQDITVQDVLRVLQPLWQTRTETASRLRGRIEAVLSWATVAGHRTGENPARWTGNLKELLPKPSQVATEGRQPALQIDDAPRWFAALRERDGMGARALEYAALTAARSGEVRGATWAEIDLEAGLWIIPAARMKMDREHRVALSAEAVALLKALPRYEGSDLVFPSSRGGQISDMTLSATMRRIHDGAIADGGPGFMDRASGRRAVPHGLRSSFRDWAAERTTFPGEMAEIALAHKTGNAVELAYRRGDQIEKRRRMMAAWADFLIGKAGGKIVRMAQ